MTDAFAAIAQKHFTFLTLSVYYSLLYVVIEGYRDNELHDEDIDLLLLENEYVESLRRFRNATFHFQKEPISAKLMEFLEKEGGENWILDLNRAFRAYFERSLDLKSVIKRFQE